MRPLRILELRSVWGTGGGPEKTILLGTERANRDRYAITVCYIRDERDTVFGPGAALASGGIDYVEIRERHSFDAGIWRRLTALVESREIDIVHSHDYKTDVLAWGLGWRHGLKVMATVHGWTGHSARERWAYYPLDKRVLARFPALIAVSSQIRRELIRTGTKPARVQTVLNGIDHEAFRRDRSRQAEARRRFELPDDAVIIGSVGRAEPQKRFDLLVRAFAEIAREKPDVHLVIAGTGSCDAQLRDLVIATGLSGRIRLLGHCPEVPLLHHALDLFVQSSDYEGTPNAVLEAMAFETPVVATDAGGTSELIRSGVDGLVVPVGDVLALSRAISHAVDDPTSRVAWAGSARHRAETELSFATRMTRVETVYDNLAAGRPPFAGLVPLDVPA